MKPWRSASHLKWVRSLPCCNCGTDQNVQAHHLIGLGHLSGMGTKAPDTYTMALCALCHHHLHHHPTMWPMQWEWVARTLAKQLEEA